MEEPALAAAVTGRGGLRPQRELLGELVRQLDAAAPYELVEVCQGWLSRHLGAQWSRLLLVDYSQTVLEPVPDHETASPHPRDRPPGSGCAATSHHLAISFCRALNIPARHVFGYLPDMNVPVDPAPMDFAAWMQVWLGDRWWSGSAQASSGAASAHDRGDLARQLIAVPRVAPL